MCRYEHAIYMTGDGRISMVRALHFPLSHSFSHTNLKSPRAEQAGVTTANVDYLSKAMVAVTE